MKKITILSITAAIFSFTYFQASEGHSYDLPEFLHFLEELVEEHGILRGFVFGFIHTLIPLIGFYSGWSINRFFKSYFKWSNSRNSWNSFSSYYS